MQHIIINKIISNNQQILVFLLRFSVALAQNTTGITTATAMAAAGRNGPLAPHMMPSAPHWRHEWMGDNPLSKRMCPEPFGPKPGIQHDGRGRGMPTLTWEEVTIKEGKKDDVVVPKWKLWA